MQCDETFQYGQIGNCTPLWQPIFGSCSSKWARAKVKYLLENVEIGEGKILYPSSEMRLYFDALQILYEQKHRPLIQDQLYISFNAHSAA